MTFSNRSSTRERPSRGGTPALGVGVTEDPLEQLLAALDQPRPEVVGRVVGAAAVAPSAGPRGDELTGKVRCAAGPRPCARTSPGRSSTHTHAARDAREMPSLGHAAWSRGRRMRRLAPDAREFDEGPSAARGGMGSIATQES
jgi:hypothetical protein